MMPSGVSGMFSIADKMKVFINGVPDLTQIPKNITDALVTALKINISEHYEQKNKRNNAVNE